MQSQRRLLVTVLFLSIAWPWQMAKAQIQSEDLSVLEGWNRWSDAKNQLQRQLNSVAFQLLEKRRAEIGELRSVGDWKARQIRVRKVLDEVISPFPPKTPLNARVLGSLRKEDYLVEKIIFESRPKFYVTGCLFIPEARKGKSPAILDVLGHTDIAFRAPGYQQLLLNLVKKGFVVFAMDPIGQGERLQYYDSAQRRSLVGGPTTEHSYLGNQCFLSGGSAAHYFTWDGIRAIDYLVSRPEVDAARIGVTGISGGGTQTSYIAAFDERVLAAAPTCYITSYQRLLESIGPQDAEQNFNGGLRHGIDHADLLEVRAPRPTLVVSTTRDFFSIQGARETFMEAKSAFRALGAEESLTMIEDDHGHGYTKKTREAIYGFFQKYLNNPGSPTDDEVQILRPEELTVTSTGQVSDSMGGETVFTLNRSAAGNLIDRLEESRRDLPTHLPRVKEAARELSGYVKPTDPPGVIFRGRYPRAGYQVELYALTQGDTSVLPVLLFVPEGKNPHPALIYLHPQGKAASAQPGGEMEHLVKLGFSVLAPDLSGTGELGQVTESTAFLGVQVGRPIAGIRAADIIRCLQFLKSREEINPNSVSALARGEMCIPLLHAAVFEESLKQITLVEPLVSLESVVMSRFYHLDPGSLIGNILTAYDLPDLAAALAPRKLALVDIFDQLHQPASADPLKKGLEVVRRSYLESGVPDNLMVTHSTPGRSLAETLSSFLR
ncbi:MAG TPA: acetylxylan esterase [Terriglobia bacterium]|nr:acetylxylan esterase [Terriglobia bacterium]